MTKQEIIDAINASIVSNNKKGITAQALANILIEIVNAAPESGSGILMLQCNNGIEDPTFTEQQKANNKAIYDLYADQTSDELPPPLFFGPYPVGIIGAVESDGTMLLTFFVGAMYEPHSLYEGFCTPVGMTVDIVLSPDGTFTFMLQ